MATKDNKTNTDTCNDHLEKEKSFSERLAEKMAQDPIIIYYDKQKDYYEKHLSEVPPIQMPKFYSKNI